MRSLPEPFSEDIEARKQNDIWTLGQILSAMAHVTYNAMEHEVLSRISLLATADVPSRIPLPDAISILSSSLFALDDSEFAPVNAVRVKAAIGAVTQVASAEFMECSKDNYRKELTRNLAFAATYFIASTQITQPSCSTRIF